MTVARHVNYGRGYGSLGTVEGSPIQNLLGAAPQQERVLALTPVRASRPVADRFWDRVDQSGSCWLWTGGTSGGRPVLYVGGRRQRHAHRFVWELHFGPITEDQEVVRSCRVAMCVRPDHLLIRPRKRIGTQPIPLTKRCRECNVVKDSAEFPRKAQKVDGLESYCTCCRAVRQREANLVKYGITDHQYRTMVAGQGGVCAACGNPPRNGKGRRLHVDHDHATGVIRGLLCMGCNIAIGQAKENPARLRAMADYLERKL